MKRAVWLPNWIGDAVMATPALRLLRQTFPQDELIGIYRRPIDATLAGTTLFDEYLLDRADAKNSWREKLQFVRRLRGLKIAEVTLLTNSARTAAVSRLAGIPRRIGFDRDGRRWLLTDRLQPHSRKKPNPVLEEYLRLIAVSTGTSDLTTVDRRLELACSSADRLQWNTFAARHGLEAGRYICFNSGGAFGAAKHWPTESFARLARMIAERYETSVVMLCGPAEEGLARQFTELAAHPRVCSLAGEKLSVGLSKVLVQHAGAMITTDSGPRHFAAAFDVPVITLFGPTHIAWSESFYPKAVHLQLALDCGPCQQRVCPLGHHRCMQDLSPEQVLQAFETLWNQKQQTARPSQRVA